MSSNTVHTRTPQLLIGLGLLSYMLSVLVERGFAHGLFLGMAVALVLIGVYLMSRLGRRRTRDDEGGMWLPSGGRRNDDV